MNLNFSVFKKALSEVRQQHGALVCQMQKKRDEIAHLRTAPLQHADLIDLFDQAIDVKAAEYDAAFSHAVNRMVGDPGSASRINDINVVAAAPSGVAPNFNSIECSVCALLGAELKASIRQRVGQMPQTGKAGPFLRDRPGLIKAAERELAGMEREMTKLRNDAAEAGVTF